MCTSREVSGGQGRFSSGVLQKAEDTIHHLVQVPREGGELDLQVPCEGGELDLQALCDGRGLVLCVVVV